MGPVVRPGVPTVAPPTPAGSSMSLTKVGSRTAGRWRDAGCMTKSTMATMWSMEEKIKAAGRRWL
jgi:hypothetical protein